MEDNVKILVLDDEEDIIDIYKEYLSEIKHFDVDYNFDSEVAWKLVETNQYDILILDHIMPIISGREFAEKIKTGDGPNKNTPIIFITATPNLLEEIRGKYEGIEVLSKPLDFQELNYRIRSMSIKR